MALLFADDLGVDRVLEWINKLILAPQLVGGLNLQLSNSGVVPVVAFRRQSHFQRKFVVPRVGLELLLAERRRIKSGAD